MIRIVRGPDYVPPPPIVMEEVTDPEYNARANAQSARFKANSHWLENHWADVLPQARGKYVAVADQQPHVAETAEEAWAWCDREHPDDDGPVVQYVHATPAPRIYAIHG